MSAMPLQLGLAGCGVSDVLPALAKHGISTFPSSAVLATVP